MRAAHGGRARTTRWWGNSAKFAHVHVYTPKWGGKGAIACGVWVGLKFGLGQTCAVHRPHRDLRDLGDKAVGQQVCPCAYLNPKMGGRASFWDPRVPRAGGSG